MSKVKAGLQALKELLFAEPKLMEEAVDPAKRRFLGLAPTDNLPVPVHEDLLKGAESGNRQAIEALAQQSGQNLPVSAQDLQSLVSRFTSPSRRGFLQGAGNAAAHLLMPSPLKLLRETTQHIPIHLELTPSEMMRYSQKYMDRDIPTSALEWLDPHGDVADVGDELKLRDVFSMSPYSGGAWPSYEEVGLKFPSKLPREQLFKNDPTYMAKAKSIVDSRYRDVFKTMELEPTDKNIESFGELQDHSDFFHPDTIDSSFDDMKHEAQAYATGDYTTVDAYLEQVAKERGQTVEELHDELEQFLSHVHGDGNFEEPYKQSIAHAVGSQKDIEALEAERKKVGNYEFGKRFDVDTHVGARRNLDQQVEENAYERGYIEPEFDEELDPDGFGGEVDVKDLDKKYWTGLFKERPGIDDALRGAEAPAMAANKIVKDLKKSTGVELDPEELFVAWRQFKLKGK